MAEEKLTVWGIHAGKTGDADTLFLEKKRIALGWGNLGDLSKLKCDREAFKEKVREGFPGKRPGAVANNAGQLYRFVHELQIGDVVVYPSKLRHRIYLGWVKGPYEYNPGMERGYPHLRTVTWVHDYARTHFTQGALYESGSGMSFFMIRNYADEFLAAIEGKDVPDQPEEEEAPVTDASDIEENTGAFVIKTLARTMKGHPFTRFVAHLLETMGYRTRVAPEGPDGGVDIIAHKDELGVEPPIIKVQVKSSEGNVGNDTVTALYGNVGNSEFGLIVTLGAYTNSAKHFARGKTNLRLIDGRELVDLVFEYYERLDSTYRGLIPLKRVYVPESLGAGEEE